MRIHCPYCMDESSAPKYIRGDFKYRQCGKCQLLYLHPSPTQEELEKIYSGEQYFETGGVGSGYSSYDQEIKGYRQTFAKKLKRLERLGLRKDVAILEIGPGPGIFLEEARQAGYTDLRAVELNPEIANHLQSKGFKVVQGTLDYLPAGLTFDVITMFDLIEHITDPISFVRQLSERIKPGGVVFITTPSTDSLLAKVSGAGWVSLKVPEHVCLYNRKNLAQILKENKFRVLLIKPTFQFVSLSFVASRLSTVSKYLAPAGKLLGYLPDFLLNRFIPVSSGSIDLIARKTD